MSTCNTCAKPFGWFSKELGCPRCKRVFCKKCLNHRIPESADNLKKLIYVCLRCSKIPLNDPSPKKPKQEQIEELLKLSPKEEAFEPVLEPMSSTGLTDDIRNRLDALKKSNLPDEAQDQNNDDIQKRLAALKGVEFKDYSASNVLFTNDTRSEQEKIDDLLKQFVEEKTIDDDAPEPSQVGTIDDIERRLAALRGQDLAKTKEQIEQIEETEEEEAERTMKQYLEEAKLDDIVLDPDEQELIASIPPAPEGKKPDLDELPFCEICNEDATLRCLECENLFCVSCYREFHEEEDYKSHKTKPYQAPKSNEM